ncbi:MAG: DUF1587 domain-containing protein, partial [Planctomycetota bacterium]
MFFPHSRAVCCRAGLIAILLLAHPVGSHGQEPPLASQASNALTALDPLDQQLTAGWIDTIKPLMTRHCGDCHMGDGDEGGVNLDDYDSLAKIRSHESTWEQIRGVIRAEAMPPPDSATITPAERATLGQWIERVLHEVDCGCRPPVPEVTIRRLNQAEYDATIRDLIGLDLQPSKVIGFVSDDVGNGFDNQGEVLTLPPIALEKYMQAAAFVAEKVIAIDREQFRKQSFEVESLAFGNRIEAPVHVAQGTYVVSVRARFGDDQKDSCKARLRWDDQIVVEWEIPPKNENFKQEIDSQNVPAKNFKEVRMYLEMKHFNKDAMYVKSHAAAEAAKQEMVDAVARSQARLDLAQRLVSALESENIRWRAGVESLSR